MATDDESHLRRMRREYLTCYNAAAWLNLMC